VSETSSSSAAVSNGGTSTVQSPARRVEVKPLTDISVPLESIKPGEVTSYICYMNLHNKSDAYSSNCDIHDKLLNPLV
jgi:hypothetical protein